MKVANGSALQILLLAASLVAGCSTGRVLPVDGGAAGESGAGGEGAAGSTGTGGIVGLGGGGGAPVGTGGVVDSGGGAGHPAGGGGASANGTGGMIMASGGVSAGGAASTGGAVGTGGVTSNGGAVSTGGAAGLGGKAASGGAQGNGGRGGGGSGAGCGTGQRMCGTTCIMAAPTNCCPSASPNECSGNTPVCDGTSNTCVGKASGQVCGGGVECATGKCVNGVCCASASCPSCQRCDVNGAGTCANVAKNTADPACVANPATCTGTGCNGNGACNPAASGVSCGTACINDNGTVAGQYAQPSATRKKLCSGTASGTAACATDMATAPTSCGAGLVCGDASTCATSCITHSNCAYGYYCNAGTCTAGQAADAMCSSPVQCLNTVCTSARGFTGLICGQPCNTGYECLALNSGGTTPVCHHNFPTTAGCVACSAPSENTACNPDGSLDCRTEVCPANAPNCGATDHRCHCGTGAACPLIGQICVGGQCKVTGLWPCVAATDCAYGACTNGACPPIPAAGVCPSLLTGECASPTTCQAPVSTPGVTTCR